MNYKLIFQDVVYRHLIMDQCEDNSVNFYLKYIPPPIYFFYAFQSRTSFKSPFWKSCGDGSAWTYTTSFGGSGEGYPSKTGNGFGNWNCQIENSVHEDFYRADQKNIYDSIQNLLKELIK